MSGVLFREVPAVLEDWLEERRAKGLDGRDEVWEGVYVVAPAPRHRNGWLAVQLHERLNPSARQRGLRPIDVANVGTEGDYRIPDYLIADPAVLAEDELWVRTAVLVAEILSPGEDPDAKLGFYLDQGVGEVVVLDPRERTLRWLVPEHGTWIGTDRSPALGLAVADVAAALDWG